nr:unnamed protein product [Digitaria exilis]
MEIRFFDSSSSSTAPLSRFAALGSGIRRGRGWGWISPNKLHRAGAGTMFWGTGRGRGSPAQPRPAPLPPWVIVGAPQKSEGGPSTGGGAQIRGARSSHAPLPPSTAWPRQPARSPEI